MAAMPASLMRHILACNNTPSPPPRLPFRMAGAQVGWVPEAVAEALDGHGGFIRDAGGLLLTAETPAARSAAMEDALPGLVGRGLLRRRGEGFDIRAAAEGTVLAVLDRGAIPAFGVIGHGVHLNGLVRRADGLHVWVGVRSATKAVAPGQLDNIVGGGVSAGHTPRETLLKEAMEEAAIPPGLAARAEERGRISYVLTLPEGLRRDMLHVFDLELPEDFIPRPNDDEVERFELWPAQRLLAAIRDTDNVKFNVNLVLIDLFLREGLIPNGDAEGELLRAGLQQPL